MATHASLTKNHRLENWVYANAAARTGATGLLPADVGKISYQSSDGSYWRLLDDSPVTWARIDLTEHDLPTGGTTGQLLKKNSNTDRDVGWTNPPTGGGGGGGGIPSVSFDYVFDGSAIVPGVVGPHGIRADGAYPEVSSKLFLNFTDKNAIDHEGVLQLMAQSPTGRALVMLTSADPVFVVVWPLLNWDYVAGQYQILSIGSILINSGSMPNDGDTVTVTVLPWTRVDQGVGGLNPTPYLYDALSNTAGSPGVGKIRFDNSSISSASHIYFADSAQDMFGKDNDVPMGLFAGQTTPVVIAPGKLIVSLASNPRRFFYIFSFDLLVNASGYQDASVTLERVYEDGAPPGDKDQLILSYLPA